MTGDLALQPGAQGFFAAQGVGYFGGEAFGGGQGCPASASSAGRVREGAGEASALQIQLLQLYELFDMLLHLCYKSLRPGEWNQKMGRGAERE